MPVWKYLKYVVHSFCIRNNFWINIFLMADFFLNQSILDFLLKISRFAFVLFCMGQAASGEIILKISLVPIVFLYVYMESTWD